MSPVVHLDRVDLVCQARKGQRIENETVRSEKGDTLTGPKVESPAPPFCPFCYVYIAKGKQITMIRACGPVECLRLSVRRQEAAIKVQINPRRLHVNALVLPDQVVETHRH